jgi:hypothetical protein
MKYPGIKILLVLAVATVAFAGIGIIDYFQVRTSQDNVIIEWKSGTESNIDHYSIERKTPQQNYFEIVTVPPKGSNQFYSYTDQSIYKAQDVLFVYRLKIVYNDNTTPVETGEVSVSPNISGVKRTWGSIKAMFR